MWTTAYPLGTSLLKVCRKRLVHQNALHAKLAKYADQSIIKAISRLEYSTRAHFAFFENLKRHV